MGLNKSGPFIAITRGAQVEIRDFDKIQTLEHGTPAKILYPSLEWEEKLLSISSHFDGIVHLQKFEADSLFETAERIREVQIKESKDGTKEILRRKGRLRVIKKK